MPDQQHSDFEKRINTESQPTLFSLLNSNLEEKELNHKYSYHTDLYDAAPKFWMSKNLPRKDGKYLDQLMRTFEHKGQMFTMTLTPANIEDKYYYPGVREEFIEMELTQMALEKGVPLIDGSFGIPFSFYELRKRLKDKGHSYSFYEIKESLFVMSRCNLTIMNESGSTAISESLFKSVGLRTWDDWQDAGRGSLCYVEFNSLHVAALKEGKWKLFNQQKAIGIKTILSRWIYKRMSREWIGATQNYSIQWRLTSIIRDSGMEACRSIRDARPRVEKAFESLRIGDRKNLFGGDVIRQWSAKEELGGPRGTKLIDIVYTIIPGSQFIQDMKRCNQLRREAKDKIIKINDYADKNKLNKLPFGN